MLNRLGEKAPNVKINEDLASELLNAKTQDEIDVAVDKIQQNIADQIPSTWMEKWNAWRYLSMLGNPTTHIRNVLGNAVFVPATKLKNIIGTGLEKAPLIGIAEGERTKTLTTSKVNRSFAAADFDSNIESITGENKYDIKSGIDEKRTIFKNKALEKMRRLNFAGLEGEDRLFLRRAYIDSFAQAMQARGVTSEYLKSGTKEANQQLNNISLYATNQAKKATYRDDSALANALNQFEKIT